MNRVMPSAKRVPCPICSSFSSCSCSPHWRAASCRLLGLALSLLLAGCGGLPRPFDGNPGATALRLAQPPPPRLAVPLPGAAFLKPDAAKLFASALADALVARGLPVLAGPAQRGDWRVVPSVQTHADMILPAYTIEDARPVEEGIAYGTPIPAETWVAAAPDTLRQAAETAAPAIARQLARIDAKLKESDPNSLLNRPPRVAFSGVAGAPGDGDEALARLMRADLGTHGLDVQNKPAGADYLLRGTVAVTPLRPGTSLVEITWTVDNPAGAEQGKVSQLHEIAAGSLDHFWGDVAVVVAQQAAAGVNELITNQIHPPPARPAAPGS
jgi:hypothetical protein